MPRMARRAHGKVRRSDRAGRCRPEGTGSEETGRATAAAFSHHRLLVLAPLRIEQLALSPGGRVGPTTLVIERIGMGLAKARESAGRLSSAPPPDAVAVAGVGGSLIDKLQPGDLVVAELVIDTSGREVAWLASAPSLAADLRHLGLRARSGTVVSTDHIVTGRRKGDARGARRRRCRHGVVCCSRRVVARAPGGGPCHLRHTGAGAVFAWRCSRSAESAARPTGIAPSACELGRRGRPADTNTNANSNKKREIFLAAPRSSSAAAPDELANFSLPLEVR